MIKVKDGILKAILNDLVFIKMVEMQIQNFKTQIHNLSKQEFEYFKFKLSPICINLKKN